jgi:hypothetical protein
MTRLLTLLLATATCLFAVAFSAATASAAGPTGFAAAKNCGDISPGGGYLTNIRVSGTGCTTGQRVARAHRACRLKKGRRGTCNRTVLGFRCQESGRQSSSTQITARVACRDGSKRVNFVYSQNV